MKSNSLELRDMIVAREGAALTMPLSVTLQGGEMLVVHGTNGSGKSTLLKTIAGLLKPLDGEILFNGQQAAEYPPVYLGHKQGLARELTVRDNVMLWARLSSCLELVDAAMHYFELQDIADVSLSKLSAGWQQRVMLTRLITQQAALWLLDEPTSNLDTEGIQLLQTLMQTRLEQGGMIIVATHADLRGQSIKTININELNNNFKVKALC